jgi:hypothetical protein
MSYMEDIYSCLNEFTPSEMSIPALMMRNALISKISSGDNLAAYQVVEKLKSYGSTCKFTREKVEIFTECGLAYFRMGSPYQAMETIRIALANCSPGSHEQAILHWMAGEAEWNVNTERFSAMKTWEIAIEDLNSLATQADYENRISSRDWYRDTRDQLEAVLMQRAKTASFDLN